MTSAVTHEQPPEHPLLKAGDLAEHGTHDELIAVRGRYATTFEAQQSSTPPTARIPNLTTPTVSAPHDPLDR
ncbi:hypothetical protein ACFVTT_27925 [Streptomyces niveus]|uniref:hypothetical protein n=1 Tax=Streptomyces niveus TaxID=193462 RepID=UPI003445A88F